MTVTLIIGASRGIGLALAKKAAAEPDSIVIATVRDVSKTSELQALANVKIITVDQAIEESIAQLGAQLEKVTPDGIDTVIFNAAVFRDVFKPVLQAPRENWLLHYNANVVGPIEIAKVVYPYLKKKDTKRLVFITSLAGSLGAYFGLSTSAYGQSKAALNYTALVLSHELKDEGFTVLAVHPGVVSTDGAREVLEELGPEVFEPLLKTSITPEESAEGIITTLSKITVEDNGKFIDLYGEVQTW